MSRVQKIKREVEQYFTDKYILDKVDSIGQNLPYSWHGRERERLRRMYGIFWKEDIDALYCLKF